MPSGARIRITRTVNDRELVAQVLPKMEALGQAIGARAQRLVPKKTWALHDSISSSTDVRGSSVVAIVGAGGNGIDYAMHVERGTSRMAAQPYLRPAMLQMKASDLAGGGRGIVTHGVGASPKRPTRRGRR